MSTPKSKKVCDGFRARQTKKAGIERWQVHILVYKRPFLGEDREGKGCMCDVMTQTTQEQIGPAGRERDVDDLIFRDEQEWLASDR